MKFDGEQLPSIFNALVATNGGQKLVLEVAVCATKPIDLWNQSSLGEETWLI